MKMLSESFEELLDKAKAAGVVTDVGSRWEKGIEHHPEASFLLEFASELLFPDFDLRLGGDGDNGEAILLALSVAFEMRDAGLFEGVPGFPSGKGDDDG